MKERNSTAAISVKAPVIGLPRAMLYDRYEVLWKSFFSALGMKGIVSKPTNKAMIEAGSTLAIDEACLSTKIYLGAGLTVETPENGYWKLSWQPATDNDKRNL